MPTRRIEKPKVQKERGPKGYAAVGSGDEDGTGGEGEGEAEAEPAIEGDEAADEGGSEMSHTSGGGMGSPLSKVLIDAGTGSHVKRQELARQERARREKALKGRGVKPWTGEVTVPVGPTLTTRRKGTPAAGGEGPKTPWSLFQMMRSPWGKGAPPSPTAVPSPMPLMASPAEDGAGPQASMSPESDRFFTPSPSSTATPQVYSKSTALERKHDHELQMSVQKNAVDLLAEF